MIDVVAFDADDTLWHNEPLYLQAKDKYVRLLSSYESPERITQALNRRDIEDLPTFGYGIKSFTLSMVGAAVDVTGGRVKAGDIREIVNIAREMLEAKLKLFDHAEETLAELSASHPLMLITKGDLFEQEGKVIRSGLAPYFRHIEILGDKTPESYRSLLDKYQIDAGRFLMVGNSLRSDILPVIALGGTAVYIPYPLTWEHEMAVEAPSGNHQYHELEHLGQVPGLVHSLIQTG